MSDQMTTATVQTLTAEVRVLMVGSRQVTLSVFNQLDSVDWIECQPMGRVNPREEGKWIVGRNSDNSLVRADLGSRPRWTYNEHQEFERLRHFKDRSVAEEKRFADLEALFAYVQSEQVIWDAAEKLYRSLPLIVLAGLK